MRQARLFEWGFEKRVIRCIHSFEKSFTNNLLKCINCGHEIIDGGIKWQ